MGREGLSIMQQETSEKKRAGRNKTITLTQEEVQEYSKGLVKLDSKVGLAEIKNKIIHQDLLTILDKLPDAFVDLLFVDPPYNLSKNFNSSQFKEMKNVAYEEWVEVWLQKLVRILKPNASIYICGDWKSSSALFRVMSEYFVVRNRITWEREKGRGAKSNWKNCSEDIWFATLSDDYYFNAEAVKLKRKVIAPYRNENREPKDWQEENNGNYRLTHPSNLWSDLTVPFWSMPENTDHPTQKPEKLVAKIILASSKAGDLVFDPFLGSGTASVVAKKLGIRLFQLAGLDFILVPQPQRFGSSRMGLTDNFHRRYDLNMPVGVDFQIDLIPVFQSTLKSTKCQSIRLRCVSVNDSKVLYR